MSDFHNVRLPACVLTGATGGPGFKTTIITASSGQEYRNQDWQKARGKWDVGYRNRHEEVQAIIDFFYARRGRAYGFRFKDWSDYQVDNVIGMTDGVQRAYQAIKIYQSGNHQYHRKLTRLVAGFKVFVGDVPVAASVNLDTGVITLPTWPAPEDPPVPHVPQPIRIVGEFDVPVRFDVDELPLLMHTRDVSEIGSVPVVEIRDGN